MLSPRLNERCLGQQRKHFVLLPALLISIPIFVPDGLDREVAGTFGMVGALLNKLTDGA